MIDDNINHAYIIRYLRDLIPARKGLLKEMEDYANKHEVPISQPETIRLLEFLTALTGAENILEVGCAIGYSAICMVKAGAKHVDTIEVSEEMAAKAKENFKKADLADQICLFVGDAKTILPTLNSRYDLIFIDAAKAQYNEFFPHCMRMLKPGGLLVSDNVLYKGMTATDELMQRRKITIIKRLRNYLSMLSSHEELSTSVLPVGDGVALSLRKKKEFPHD